MRRGEIGPRRTQSVDAYLRGTRMLAALAMLLLAGAILFDSLQSNFWVRHALLTGLVASLIIVMLSAAVLNEILERRRRQRWSVLAQYVMLELVRNARLIWTGVLEYIGLLAPDAATPNLRRNEQSPRARHAAHRGRARRDR